MPLSRDVGRRTPHRLGRGDGARAATRVRPREEGVPAVMPARASRSAAPGTSARMLDRRHASHRPCGRFANPSRSAVAAQRTLGAREPHRGHVRRMRIARRRQRIGVLLPQSRTPLVPPARVSRPPSRAAGRAGTEQRVTPIAASFPLSKRKGARGRCCRRQRRVGQRPFGSKRPSTFPR